MTRPIHLNTPPPPSVPCREDGRSPEELPLPVRPSLLPLGLSEGGTCKTRCLMGCVGDMVPYGSMAESFEWKKQLFFCFFNASCMSVSFCLNWFVCLCLCICPTVCIAVCLSACICMFFNLILHLSICLLLYPFVCISLRLPVSVFFFTLSVCFSIYLSLFICISVRLFL